MGTTKTSVGQSTFHTLGVKLCDSSLIRDDTLKNEKYLVIPVVALVEGVIHSSNAANPELALASEFGAIPESWDGSPILVDHPRENGKAVSANRPNIWSEQVLGMMFNTTLDEETRSLKSEMWLNKKWMKAAGQSDLEDAFREGVVEVSTGLFAQHEETSGIFNNEKYDGIWRNVVPDHLAILPNSIGACSVEDGCGAPRTNQEAKVPDTTVKKGFAAFIQRHLGKDIGKEMVSEVQRALSLGLGTFLVNNALNDNDKFTALQTALAAVEMEDNTYYRYVSAVFPDDFVYCEYTYNGMKYYKVKYNISDAGSVTLNMSGRVQVRPETQFVPVDVKVNEAAASTNSEASPAAANTESGESSMSNQAPAAGAAPITQAKVCTCGATPAANAGTTEQVSQSQTAQQPAATTPAQAAPAAQTPTTLEAALASMAPEQRAQVEEALKFQASRKEKLVKDLLANKANTFPEAELKAMSVEALERITALAAVPAQTPAAPTNFSGAAGAPSNQSSGEDERFTPPTPIFNADYFASLKKEAA